MMLYLVYAVLGVNSSSWRGEIERDDLTSCSSEIAVLSTRLREIRGDEGNHHEKLGLKRISCVSQFTIPDTAGTSPDPAGNFIDTSSSKPHKASRTPDFAYSLISSILFSYWSPFPLFLVHTSTIIARIQSQVIPPYLSMPWSRVNTECSIHQVQHSSKIVCRPFILTLTGWPLNVALTSGVPPYTSTATCQFSITASNVKSACHIPRVLG